MKHCFYRSDQGGYLKDIEKFFRNNLINYHPSRLPIYSGGADVSWRIMTR